MHYRMWRMQGIPQSFDRETLAKALRTHRELECPVDANNASSINQGHANNGAAVHTIARALDGRTQIATVHFNSLPQQLQDLTKGRCLTIFLEAHISSVAAGSKRKRGSLQGVKVTIDDRFNDLTVLHSPPEHGFDILAVSGLGSHPFGSFASKDDGHMWLADSLPEDFPNARVIIYGHDTTLQSSTSFAELDDLAGSFQMALGQVLQPQPRRIILVGHSLGGLLIKEAIVRLSESDADADLLVWIVGCLFFGVPNDGMKIESLIPMVADQPNRSLLESIRHMNSQVLNMQKRNFSKVLAKLSLDLFCFFETELSPTAKEV